MYEVLGDSLPTQEIRVLIKENLEVNISILGRRPIIEERSEIAPL